MAIACMILLIDIFFVPCMKISEAVDTLTDGEQEEPTGELMHMNEMTKTSESTPVRSL